MRDSSMMNFIHLFNKYIMKSKKVQQIALKCENKAFKPMHRNVNEYIKFWTNNSNENKGGSFNVQLYLRYLQILDKNGGNV